MVSSKELYYVVEVNVGIYLKMSRVTGGYSFTENIIEAERYSEYKKASSDASKCGGRVLYYTITHELNQVLYGDGD